MLRGLHGDGFFSKVMEKILQILIIFNFFYYNFLMDVNFEILIIELYVFIIFFIFAKFQENRKLTTMSLIKYLNFKFLWYKIMLWEE